MTAHDGYKPFKPAGEEPPIEVLILRSSAWRKIPYEAVPRLPIAVLAQSLHDHLKDEPWLDSVRGREHGGWKGLRVYIGKHWMGPDPVFMSEWKGVPVEYCDMRWTQQMAHEKFIRGE